MADQRRTVHGGERDETGTTMNKGCSNGDLQRSPEKWGGGLLDQCFALRHPELGAPYVPRTSRPTEHPRISV